MPTTALHSIYQMKIVLPSHFLTVKRADQSWIFRYGQIFYRGEKATFSELIHREQEYGLTKEKIVIELFRIGAGREGYYLIDLRDRRYYYCGASLDDVNATLRLFGIGRVDPMQEDPDCEKQ